MPHPIELIVACSENRIIGRAGRLPFDIPEDKQWFHDQTANQTVVLGRICYETWPRVTLDGRRPVVISSNSALAQPGVQVAGDVPTALALAQKLPGRVMVCGGQRIYEETLPIADRILLTHVHAQVEGDTWFPEWRHLSWRESWKRESADAHYRYTFSILERAR